MNTATKIYNKLAAAGLSDAGIKGVLFLMLPMDDDEKTYSGLITED